MLFPEPRGTGDHVSARCGRSTVTPCRLCWRALTMRMTESATDGSIGRGTFRDSFGRQDGQAPSSSPAIFSRPCPDLLTPKFLAPRLRDLGSGLAGRLRGHAGLRQRPSRLPPRARPGALGVGTGGRRRWRRWTGSAAGCGSGSAPGTSFPVRRSKGCILAGGMGAWAGFLTPLNSARRADDDVHAAALRRPAAGGGHVHLHQLRLHRPLLRDRRSARPRLRRRARALGHSAATCSGSRCTISSAAASRIVGGIGVLMALVIFAPAAGAPACSTGPRRRSAGGASGSPDRLERLREGIDEAQASVVAFNSPSGWLAIFWSTVLSAVVPREQAARGLRRAPRARDPRRTSWTSCWCRRW